MRIVRFLAKAGVSSRRKAADLIKQGIVKVNDKVIYEPWVDVRVGDDVVKVRGERVTIPEKWTYIVLNKPEGVVTTCSDELGRKTVKDLIDIDIKGLVPAGRLDIESEGLLILSNDGHFINKVTHPSFPLDKEYRVTLPRKPANDVETLLDGIEVGGDFMKAKAVKIIPENQIIITLNEGKNREIRRMMGHLGYRIVRLVRKRIGNVKLGNLNAGEWRIMTRKEIEDLKELLDGNL